MQIRHLLSKFGERKEKVGWWCHEGKQRQLRTPPKKNFEKKKN